MSDTLEVVTTPWYEAELAELAGPDKERVERRLKGLRERGGCAPWRISASST